MFMVILLLVLVSLVLFLFLCDNVEISVVSGWISILSGWDWIEMVCFCRCVICDINCVLIWVIFCKWVDRFVIRLWIVLWFFLKFCLVVFSVVLMLLVMFIFDKLDSIWFIIVCEVVILEMFLSILVVRFCFCDRFVLILFMFFCGVFLLMVLFFSECLSDRYLLVGFIDIRLVIIVDCFICVVIRNLNNVFLLWNMVMLVIEFMFLFLIYVRNCLVIFFLLLMLVRMM